LPSEAEWEYAARAGSSTRYSWGNDIGKNNANCDGCGSQWDNKATAPVGQFKPNAFGLYDMHGNLREWVQDYHHDNYNGAPTNGSAWETDGQQKYRVLRGGSWSVYPPFLRSAYRYKNTPDGRNYISGGVRLARTLFTP
jgi:formylglycine-generating enzyme required for sulfatase activity